MDSPAAQDQGSRPTDRTHFLLAQRGAAILPEPANPDGQITLTDTMLAIAALAICFAMARWSIGLGLGSFALVLPALARAHVLMVRARGVGQSSNAGQWVVAFVSSAFRIALILGLVSILCGASAAIGRFLGDRCARAFISPSVPVARQSVIEWYTFYGSILGLLLLAIPLTLLALGYLVPRLLVVRDPA